MQVNDKVGAQTLETISSANNFNKWMFETIQHFSKEPVLEIGSGIGNVSKYFIDSKYNIALSDYNEQYTEILADKFTGNDYVISISCIDLIDPDFDKKYNNHLNKYQTVFALNVIEHIANDCLAIKNAKKMLRKGGTLIILVPAWQALFNGFDAGLGHCKRYTKKSLNKLFIDNNLKITKSFYFNFSGIFGWYIFGNILGRKVIPENQMGIYNSLVFLFRLIDKVLFNKIGLSVISVGVND